MYTQPIKRISLCIPCGLFPVNPTELLGNGRLDKLLEGLKKTFDYIIIDTPPLGSVIDAAVVAKRCDGSVLVLEADRTPKSMAKSVKRTASGGKSEYRRCGIE